MGRCFFRRRWNYFFLDTFEDGMKFMIMKGGSSLCAYIGIPKNHPLAGFEYDDIPVNAHGGLTFCDKGDGKRWDDNYYWYGWDYAHSGDYCDYYGKYSDSGGIKWTPQKVYEDSWNTIWDFKSLMKLTEKIVNKKYKIVEEDCKDGKN